MQGILFIEGLYNLTRQSIKTETRRTGALDKRINEYPDLFILQQGTDEKGNFIFHHSMGEKIVAKPRYKTGDIVFLKEPYIRKIPGHNYFLFKYDYPVSKDRDGLKWENKMFMPERLARVYIKITGVQCERLRQINEAAAIREGITESRSGSKMLGYSHPQSGHKFKTAVECYKDLFKAVNKKKGEAAWNRNHWVFVYTFELTTNQ